MLLYNPQAEEELNLQVDELRKRFRAIEHPKAPSFVKAKEATRATVYSAEAMDAGRHGYALKVMKSEHQGPRLEQIYANLDELKTICSLEVGQRKCLSPSGEQEFIGHHENLRCSILMPRIRELWWLDILGLQKQEQNTPGKDRTFRLAYSLAAVLSNLKTALMPHCVLSTGNVMVDANPRKLQIEFPGFEEPKYESSGTPGYQRPTTVQGQWLAAGDRLCK